MKRLASALLLIFFAWTATAQNWAQSYQQSVDAYDNYESEKALEYAELALSQIKAASDQPTKNHAVILRQLSIVCYDLGREDEALDYAQEEIKTLTLTGDDQDVNYANALQNLSVIRMARSEYGAAEPLLSRALKITLDFHTEESYEVAIAKGNLAVALFMLKKDEEATVLFDQTLATLSQYEEVGPDYYNIIYNYGSLLAEKGNYEKALGYFLEMEDYYNYETPNFEYGSMLIKVGDALDQLGRFAEAIGKYRTALDNYNDLGETDSEEQTIALNNLIIDLQKTGAFAEATTLAEDLLVKREAQAAEKPGAYANTMTNYANLLIRKGDAPLAQESLLKVMALYDTTGLDQDLTYVNALESLSGLYLADGNNKKATEAIDEALAVSEANQYDTKLYALYNQKAKVLANEAKYTEASDLATKALSEAEATFGPDALQTGYTKNTLAGILAQLGEYKKAEQLYLDILPVFENAFGNTHPEYATIAANYSSLLQLEGSYYTAEFYLKSAVNIKRATFGSDNRDFLTTYENLGLLYMNTARYTEAQAILEEVIATKQKILQPDDPSLAYSLSNQGVVKKQLAEYAEAEALFKQARDLYAATVAEQHLFYAYAVNNLALLYQKMGNIAAAKPLFEQALSIFEAETGKLTPDYATALENLATLYQMEEDYTTAKKLLEEALAIDEQVLGTEHPLYSKTLNNLASIYEENEEYEKAKELYTRALEIYQSVFGEMHPSYATTLYNLATLEQELENYDQAKTYYQRVVDIRRQLLGENHPDYSFSLYGLAHILHKTGDFEAARPLYLEVTEKYLNDIAEYFPALSESEKSAFYAKIRPVLESYLDYLMEFVLLQKGTEKDRNELIGSMYNLQLSTKALLLNASNKVRNTILSSGDEELIGLFNKWQGLKENIVKAYSMSRQELERNQLDIGALETEANEMEKQLSLKSSAFASEFEKEKITWQQVRDNLQPGEAAIEMIRIKKKMKTDSVVYVALILESGAEAQPVLATKGDGLTMEDRGFKTYKNSIIYKLQDVRSYAMFWAPFDEKIPASVTSVYLSADGIINKVNLATLYDPKAKQYLIDKYNIRLLSNTRELVEQNAAKPKLNDAQLFGYPKYYLSGQPTSLGGALFSEEEMARSFGSKINELPGTLTELRNIQEIIMGGDWQHKIYLENNATEDRIKALNSPKILHIATHGFFLEDIVVSEDEGGLTSRNAKFNPLLRSGLLLAGAENTVKNQTLPGKEDGILTAYEAMNLNLDNTELVVMSACETGLGEVKNGEGVYGLQRSFLVAGADNLVMSLWKVNDETTQLLMSSFYKNWFGGQPRMEAFNTAIANVRSNYPEPYYWGAFVILGK